MSEAVPIIEGSRERIFWGKADNSVSPTQSIYNKKFKIIKSAKVYTKNAAKVKISVLYLDTDIIKQKLSNCSK